MLKVLSSLDQQAAAVALADTVLDLQEGVLSAYAQDNATPQSIGGEIISELKEMLHLDPVDHSEHAIAALLDALDKQIDSLISVPANKEMGALCSVSDRLPWRPQSIQFDGGIQIPFGGKWRVESDLALSTVKQPELEESYNPQLDPSLTEMLSLFGKFFRHRKYPARSFWMVVGGQRRGDDLVISLVLRAYPSAVDLGKCKSLLDVVELMTKRFGHDVTLDGKTGSFFMSVDERAVTELKRTIQFSVSGKQKVGLATFFQRGGGKAANIAISINLRDYFKYVEAWSGWDKDLLEQLTSRSAISFVRPTASFAN